VFFSTECIEYMDVSENSGFSPQIIPFVHRVSIIFTIHFGVPLFLETPIYRPQKLKENKVWAIGCRVEGIFHQRNLQVF